MLYSDSGRIGASAKKDDSEEGRRVQMDGSICADKRSFALRGPDSYEVSVGATPSELWSKILQDYRQRQNTQAYRKHTAK